MWNNKTKKQVTSSTAPYEASLSYLERQLGISRHRLMEAVKAVGTDSRKIEKYLAAR